MNIMSIENPIKYVDSSGEEYTQKEFWFDEQKNEIIYKYTNGKVLTESEQKKFLKPLDAPVLPTIKKNEIFKGLPQEEIEFLNDRISLEAKENLTINDSFESLSPPPPPNKKIKIISNNPLKEKILKFLNNYGETENLELNIPYKSLNEEKIAMLSLISDDITADFIKEVIVENLLEVIKEKVKEII